MWDLDGTCPYYKVFELSAPPKKTISLAEMKYPKSKNPKPVYFLLLKLYRVTDYGVLSRNFYWLYLPGGDYKLLEPYRKRRVPLKITSEVFVKGSTYEVHMNVQNVSDKPDSRTLTCQNNFIARQSDDDFDMWSFVPEYRKTDDNHRTGLFQRICRRFSGEPGGLRLTEINGSDKGVAFFLHFSVHSSKTVQKEGADTRILPVHYSDNYFSLVPGESLPIKITFEVPPGVTPRVTLNGWNYQGDHPIH